MAEIDVFIAQSAASRARLHGFAVAVMAATFVLIVTGGNVTSQGGWMTVVRDTGASQVLDPEETRGVLPIRYDHAHVVVGLVVWVLTSILAGWLWWVEPRQVVRWLGCVAWAAVGVQALMGWMRVSQIAPSLGILHACVAHAFFCLTVVLATVTSPSWNGRARSSTHDSEPWLHRSTAILVAALVGQAVLGVILRHTGLGLTWHVAGVLVVGGCLAFAGQQIVARAADDERLTRRVNVLFGLFGAEVALGITTYLAIRVMHNPLPQTYTQAYLPTAHVVIAALMLGLSLNLALRTYALAAAAEPIRATQDAQPAMP